MDCDLVKMCLQCPALFYNSFSEEEEHPSDQPNSTNSPTNNQNDTTDHSSSTPTPTPDNPPTRSSRFEYVVEKFALCREMSGELMLMYSIWNNNQSGDRHVGRGKSSRYSECS